MTTRVQWALRALLAVGFAVLLNGAGGRADEEKKDKDPLREELLHHGLAAGLPPEAVEDEHGAEAVNPDGRALPVAVCGQQQHALGEARPRREQGVELAGLPQLIEPTQRHEDALPRSAVAPVIFNDLEVGPWSGPFDAEEHGAPE